MSKQQILEGYVANLDPNFDPLANFESKKSESNELREAGIFNCRLTRFEYPLTSHLNFDGTPKTWEKRPKPEYIDATTQVGMVFRTEDGRVFTHRQPVVGFLRMAEDLTKEQVKSGNFHQVKIYACVKTKSGDLVRILNDQRTEESQKQLGKIMEALGLPEKSKTSDLHIPIENKTMCRMKIGTQIFEEQTQYRAVAWYKIGSQMQVGESASSKDLDTDF